MQRYTNWDAGKKINAVSYIRKYGVMKQDTEVK